MVFGVLSTLTQPGTARGVPALTKSEKRSPGDPKSCCRALLYKPTILKPCSCIAWGRSTLKFTPRINHTQAARVYRGDANCDPPNRTHTPGRAALTLWQDEHHGEQRQDPMGTSGHVSAEHGGHLRGSPRAQGVITGVWGSGLSSPLLLALLPVLGASCSPASPPCRVQGDADGAAGTWPCPASPWHPAPSVDVGFLPFPPEKFPDSCSSRTDLSAYVLPSVISVLFPLSTITSH